MTWWQIALIAYLGAMAWMGWEMWHAPNEEDMGQAPEDMDAFMEWATRDRFAPDANDEIERAWD